MTTAELLTSLAGISQAASNHLVNTLVQSSLIILAGLMAAWLVRRRGAAVQSTVLRVTLLGVLASPVASWLLALAGVSGFAIDLPRATVGESVLPLSPAPGNEQAGPAAPSGAMPATFLAQHPSPELSPPLLPPVAQRDLGLADADRAPFVPGEPDQPAVAPSDAGSADTVLPGPVAEPTAVRLSPAAWVYLTATAGWLAIAALLLLRLAIANFLVLRARVLARTADPATAGECAVLARRMGVRAPAVRASWHVQSPCLVGILRPTILLPARMDSVSRDVLVHELAHLVRRDCLWQLLGCVTSAALWCQPLAWLLCRRIEHTADDVCDDFVVTFGEDRAEYARQLVDIADRFQPDWSAACVGAGIVPLRSSLAKRILRILDTSRALSTRTGLAALLAILLLGAAGTLMVGLIGTGKARAEAAAQQSDPDPQQSSGAADEQPEPAESTFAVNGRVLDPEGSPLGGAQLFFAPYQGTGESDLRVRAVSAEDGRFEFTADRSDLERLASGLRTPWNSPYVVARHAGFGPDWQRIVKPDDGADVTLRLVQDDVAIEGRIVNLEGQPVPGATIRATRLEASPDESLAAWIQALQHHGEMWNDNTFLLTKHLNQDVSGLPAAVRADGDGQFRLTGIGRQRVVELSVEGRAIETQRFKVMTHTGETIRVPYNKQEPELGTLICYPARFAHAAAPSRMLIGTVRDEQSGQFIAGATVYCLKRAGNPVHGKHSAEVVTDDSGQFRLAGLPKGSDNEIQINPPSGQPFLPQVQRVDTSIGLGDLHVDVNLQRGMVIRGRITDGGTGQPVAGAQVRYYALQNPNIGKFQGFLDNDDITTTTDEEGSYELTGLPGRGLVAVRAATDEFAAGQSIGAEQGDFRVDPGIGGRMFTTEPSICIAAQHHAIAVFSPAEDAERVTRDVVLGRGRALQVRLVGPDGKPLAGAEVNRRGVYACQWYGGEVTLEQPEFTVYGLVADTPRRLILRHQKLGLAAAQDVRHDDTGPLVVQLVPTGSIVGRLIDEQGQAVAFLKVRGSLRGGPALDRDWFEVSTDEDGRFRIEQRIGGLGHLLRGLRRAGQQLVLSPRGGGEPVELVVESGQTLDLGDILVDPTDGEATAAVLEPAAESSEKTAAVEPAAGEEAGTSRDARDQVLTFRGQVLDTSGAPLAGAGIYVPAILHTPVLTPEDVGVEQRARTGPGGRFSVTISLDGYPPTMKQLPLIAHAPGFGLAWQQVQAEVAPGEVTLRLRPENVIRGRALDTEGRPVAGAMISISGLLAPKAGSLDSFLTSWKNEWHLAPLQADRLFAQLHSVFGTTADEQGEFVIRGVGEETVAFLEVTHPSMARAARWVVNRAGFEPQPFNEAALNRLPASMRLPGRIPQLVGLRFDLVLESGITLEGTVYTGDDRAPVAGATVASNTGYNAAAVAVTDSDGRYTLSGLPRDGERLVSVTPGKDHAGLLRRTLAISPQKAESTMQFDVQLRRGVVVTGQVIDAQTGAGVEAGIRFVPLPGNVYFDQPGYDLYRRDHTMESTDQDGRFRIVTIPGPGVLMAQARHRERMGQHEIKPFRQAAFDEEDAQHVPVTGDGQERYFTGADNSITMLSIENAVRYLDIDPEIGTAEVDLVLDRGRRVDVEILDDQGRAISGAFAAGVTESWPITFQLSDNRCTVFGLGEDRPRKLVLLHPERRLGAVLTLQGNEDSPVTVRLAPVGRIEGRAVDEGAPLENAAVIVNFGSRTTSELYRFARLQEQGWQTDEQGRFQVDHLIPGERFALDFREGDGYYRAEIPGDKRETEAGRTRDYGDVAVKRLSF